MERVLGPEPIQTPRDGRSPRTQSHIVNAPLKPYIRDVCYGGPPAQPIRGGHLGRKHTMNTRTQYGIDHQGRDLGLTFDSREDVDRYVDRAIACGANPADYQVKHRTVTWGDWASTTPSPAQLADRGNR